MKVGTFEVSVKGFGMEFVRMNDQQVINFNSSKLDRRKLGNFLESITVNGKPMPVKIKGYDDIGSLDIAVLDTCLFQNKEDGTYLDLLTARMNDKGEISVYMELTSKDGEEALDEFSCRLV